MAKKTQAREPRVKLLVSILPPENEIPMTEICNEFCVSLHFSGIGFGTVRSNYRTYLGLDETEKRILYALIPDHCEKQLLRALNSRLRLYLMGRGIAFTVPLSGISNIVSRAILTTPLREDGTNYTREKDLTDEEQRKMHEMIIAIVNHQYTENVIDAARAAGATGATIMHTRSVNNAPAEHLIGTSLTTESDTLLLLTTHEYKRAIMESIRDTAGLKTEGDAVIFSLPVDGLVGLGRVDGNEDN